MLAADASKFWLRFALALVAVSSSAAAQDAQRSGSEPRAEQPNQRTQPAGDEWLAQRFAIVARIEAALASEAIEEARGLLHEWTRVGVGALVDGLDDARTQTVCERVDVFASALGEHELVVAVRRVECERAEALAPGSEWHHATLVRYAGTLLDAGEAALARQHYERSLALRQAEPEPSPDDLYVAHFNVAITALAQGDRAAEVVHRRFVLDHLRARSPDDHQAIERALYRLGSALEASLDHAAAAVVFEELLASTLRRFPPDGPDVRWARVDLAYSLVRGERFADALVQLEIVNAIDVTKLDALDEHRLEVEYLLGMVLKSLGEDRAALAFMERAEAGYARIDPPASRRLAQARWNQGDLLVILGDAIRARDVYERALAELATSEERDRDVERSIRSNLAALRHQLGDGVGALAAYEEVRAGLEALVAPDDSELLRVDQNIATVLLGMGEHGRSREILERVIAVFEATRPADDRELLHARLARAALLHVLGESAAALSELEAIRPHLVAQTGLESDLVVRLDINRALATQVLGDLAAASAIAEEVLARTKQSGRAHAEHLRLALTIAFELRWRSGDRVGARTAAAEQFEFLRRGSRGLLGESAREARVALIETLPTIERLLSWSAHEQRDDAAAIDRELFEVLEHGRAVSAAAATSARLFEEVPDLAAERQRLAELRRTIAARAAAPPVASSDVDAWRRELTGLADERDRSERGLRERLRERGHETELPGVDAIAKGLAEDAVLVTFYHYVFSVPKVGSESASAPEFRIAAFVLTADGRLRRVELTAVDRVAELARRWRAELGAPIERGIDASSAGDEDSDPTGAALRAALFDPLLAVLGEARPARLHLVLDDFLHTLPLEALPMADGRLLGECIELRVESSVLRLAAPRRDPPSDDASGTLVAFGGIDFGARTTAAPAPSTDTLRNAPKGGFATLLQSRFEAEAVGALFEEATSAEPIVATRAAATKEALAAHAPNARFLHIATHGWFAPESSALSLLDAPGESADAALRNSVALAQDVVVGFLPETLCGLALAGANHGPEGILTAEELAMLDLSNCELAVLSACETNVGIRRAGQGIQSLQTALHAAGARTAITSLWKVDDAATRRLFELFYTKLWSEKLGPADALWQAKMALRSEGHPTRDWAGWVLTGDPD
jgi:CHAT domain-containing protein/tetratricopeptide (TPR) repeat protein